MDIRGFIQKYNHETTTLGILLAGVLLTIAVYTILPAKWAPSDTFFSEGIRLTSDTYDISVYQNRSGWITQGGLPYIDHPNEYPILTLPIFALPALLAREHAFQLTFSLLMLLALCATVYTILKTTGQKKYALALLLPSALYFSLFRFDIVPALLTLLSVWCFAEKKFTPAWILLGISVGIKIYAWPLTVLYFVSRTQTKKQLQTGLLWFLGITALPPLLFGMFYGWEVLQPYFWQASRGANTDSVWGLVSTTLHSFDISSIDIESLSKILSIAAPLGLAISQGKKPHADKKTFFLTATLCILSVVLFNTFYSPQWHLWWAPLLLLASPNKTLLFLIIAHDLINYLQFPILFDVDPFGISYGVVVLLRTALFLLLMGFVYKQIKKT